MSICHRVVCISDMYSEDKKKLFKIRYYR